MKKLFKRSLVLALVLILLLQAMPLAGATNSQDNSEPDTRAIQYVVCRGTLLIDTPNDTGTPLTGVPAGTKVNYKSGTWAYNSNQWIKVGYGTYTGYIKGKYLCPVGLCYRVSAASADFYIGDAGPEEYFTTLNSGVYLYCQNYSAAGTWANVIIESNTYLFLNGYIQKSKITLVT